MVREFIVEADGGSRGNPGPAGYGSVVIDAATGETLAEAAEYIGVATNNVAEYRGLVAGLRAAHALDPQASVHVRMDSKLVVEQMSGRWKIKHPDMKPLAAEAATVLPHVAGDVRVDPARAEQARGPARQRGDGRGQAGQAVGGLALDRRAGHLAAPGGPGAPPGDAAAGAAKARAALAGARGTADARAAGNVASTASQGWSAAPDLGAPATFVLLRHGETALTPEKRFSGSGGADPELSAAGRAQAERVAAALAARGTVQAIVSSPLKRCQETARTVAARLGLDVRIEEGLRETDFGAWEGMTFGEVRERFPDDMNAWLASSKAEPTGGGESFAAVARRVTATRDRLVGQYAGRTVLLVTHVTPIKTLVRLALGAPPESLFRMELSAASLSAVAYYGDGNASVRLLNETAHLR